METLTMKFPLGYFNIQQKDYDLLVKQKTNHNTLTISNSFILSQLLSI